MIFSRRDAIVIITVCITIILIFGNFFIGRNSCVRWGEYIGEEEMDSRSLKKEIHFDDDSTSTTSTEKINDKKTEKTEKTKPKWNWNTLYPTHMLCPHVIFDYIPDRRKFLQDFVRYKYPDGIGIEVGAHQGSFSSSILSSTKLKKVYVNDAWESTDVYTGNRDPDMKRTLKSLEQYPPERYTLKKGYSFDVVHDFEDNYFDMIYIDATHTYTSSKLDMIMWWPKLKPGGVMAGHDFTLRIAEKGTKREDVLGNHYYYQDESTGEEKEEYVMNVYDAAFEFAFHHGMRAVRMGESFYIYKCTDEDIKDFETKILKTENSKPYDQLLKDKSHDYEGIWKLVKTPTKKNKKKK